MLAPALWVTTALILASCGGGGGSGSSNPPANSAPTANAGSNQTVTSADTVTLNGSGTDSDGTVASYTWTQTAGSPTVTLSSSAVAQPNFAAPSVATTATLTFSLVVRDNRGASSTASTVDVTVNPLAAGNVIGRVRFMRIPTMSSGGLNYGAQVLRPARGIQVRALAAGTQTVLATATTNDTGDFSLSVAPNTSVSIVVVAQMLRDNSRPLPRWNFSTRDAEEGTNPGALPYQYTNGTTFDSSAGTAHNIDIPSGINSSGALTGTRSSAPFAVLDTVYQSVQLVLSVAPTINFPELVLDWAANNPGGQTFFMRGDPSDPNDTDLIVLSAEVTEDTDEFDQHVIAHEFGHYVEYNFSRADNIGGAHGVGDKLDVRVAFGEGFGYAFSAIVLDDPVAIDTFVNNGSKASSTFDVEDNPPAPGDATGCWCSESSVWSILWDLYDNTADANDAVNLGFQPMWNVLIGSQRTTPAFTSLFSFIAELKAADPASVAAIDTLITAQNSTTITDIWGTGETHVPAPVAAAAALPLYTPITVGGPSVTLLNVNDAGTYNTLGNHRYLRFNVASTRNITVIASSSNPNQPDTDFLVWRAGTLEALGWDDFNENPEAETITNASPGTYVIDVYDCANGCNPEPGGDGDYNITVTITSP